MLKTQYTGWRPDSLFAIVYIQSLDGTRKEIAILRSELSFFKNIFILLLPVISAPEPKAPGVLIG